MLCFCVLVRFVSVSYDHQLSSSVFGPAVLYTPVRVRDFYLTSHNVRLTFLHVLVAKVFAEFVMLP